MKILVTGADATACNSSVDISGTYINVAQSRRGKPVWYNMTRDTYIFASRNNNWYISVSESFRHDKLSACAYSSMKNSPDCPTNIDYKRVFNEEKNWEYANCLHVLPGPGNKP